MLSLLSGYWVRLSLHRLERPATRGLEPAQRRPTLWFPGLSWSDFIFITIFSMILWWQQFIQAVENCINRYLIFHFNVFILYFEKKRANSSVFIFLLFYTLKISRERVLWLTNNLNQTLLMEIINHLHWWSIIHILCGSVDVSRNFCFGIFMGMFHKLSSQSYISKARNLTVLFLKCS